MTTTELPQGDRALLNTDTAQRLLGSKELARLAYTAKDGTPRVLPMLFLWNGKEIVFCTFAGSQKLPALRRNPDVTVLIDRPGPPPEVLTVRGKAVLTEVEGLLPEYADAQRHYYGEATAASVAELATKPGLRMVRITVEPQWVGVLDFQTRFPGGIDRGE